MSHSVHIPRPAESSDISADGVVILDPTNGLPIRGASDPVAEIIDTTSSATYAYHCEATPGTLTSAAAWRISRLTVASGVIQWADGNGKFDNIADDRATTQVYS